MSGLVSLATAPPRYPSVAPYDPDTAYPEYPFAPHRVAAEANGAYAAVRQSLALLGLDRENYGTPEWNPLRDVVPRGGLVVIKPNWVHHALPGDAAPHEILITHPAVVRAVVDYAFLACGPRGRIVIGDAPIQSADFEAILKMSGIAELVARYRDELGVELEIADFRQTVAHVTPSGRVQQAPTTRPDPRGYHIVDVGERSFLEPVTGRGGRFRCIDYDPQALGANHGPGRHRYLIAGSVMAADAILNVPKLKTHGKSGVTVALKNLVGINGDKAFLPHFRTGSPLFGGDDYPFPSLLKWSRTAVRERLVRSGSDVVWRTVRWLGRRALRVASDTRRPAPVGGTDPYMIFSGHWHGNDTTWRMVLDLNEAMFHAGIDGTWSEQPRRNYFAIVDGLIGGQRNGPLAPVRHDTGAILAGASPVAVDRAAAWLMGFDPERLALLRVARTRLGVGYPFERGIDEASLVTEDGVRLLREVAIDWRYQAADGWIGHIERPVLPIEAVA